MRRTRRSGGFFLCLLLNLLLNWEGVIPAALLFALHRWRGWPLWWAGLALVLWIGGILLWMLVIGWASDCGSCRDEPRENKIPIPPSSTRTAGLRRTKRRNRQNEEMRERHRSRICSKRARFFRSRSSCGERSTAFRQASAAFSASPRWAYASESRS